MSWYLADALGTVRDLINNSGAVFDHVDFSAFGTVLDESSPTSGDRFVSFAGLERDTLTGLNLAVEREESPGTGRWDSQDPLRFAGADRNVYRYSSNQPTDKVDPDGLNDTAMGRHREAAKRPVKPLPAPTSGPAPPVLLGGMVGWEIINHLAAKYELDAYEFDSYYHKVKEGMGRGPKDKMSYKEIEDIARDGIPPREAPTNWRWLPIDWTVVHLRVAAARFASV